jgi:hypothetical protein
VTIGRLGHLTFNHEWLTREKAEARSSGDTVAALRREEGSSGMKTVGLLWGLSNGDAFLSYVMIALLFDKLWLLQEIYATVGVVSIVALCMVSSARVKGAVRRYADSTAAA